MPAIPSVVVRFILKDGRATIGEYASTVNRRFSGWASAASVATVIDFENRRFCPSTVLTLAINVPDPPAGITESCSVTVHPQDGEARRIVMSVGPSL